ncbi:MAG: DUF3568 family protein [Deltaproteobacteria bacterium]|nr:DUF3568 family protein [Deltaproteobacteria bacterium]
MISLAEKRIFKVFGAFCLIILTGCELLPLAASPIVVSGAGGGVAYTFTNIAYKTVSYPVKQVESSLRAAFKKMDIKETSEAASDGAVTIKAKTKKLDITIELEKVTPKTTRIKVDAKDGLFFKDKATATEIITQTEKALEDNGR